VHRTIEKLEEARFFLERAREHANVSVEQAVAAGAPAALRYYLSAFFSAARSVTWVMRHEYGACPGWEEWFESKKASEGGRQLLTQTNEARIETVKRATPMPAFYIAAGSRRSARTRVLPWACR